MKNIQSYANRITKGTMELDSRSFYRAFPNCVGDLVDYCVDRLRDAGDRRIVEGCAGGLVDFHVVKFKASSTVHPGDTFDKDLGEALVKVKLHRKALAFIEKLRASIEVTAKDLWNALERVKVHGMDEIRDRFFSKESLGEPKFDDGFISYTINDNISVAQMTIPFHEDEGVDVSLDNICDDLFRAIQEYDEENIRYGVLKELDAEIRRAAYREFRGQKAIRIKAITRRSEEDPHDEMIVRRILCNKLQFKYEALYGRLIRKVRREILDKQLNGFRPWTGRGTKRYEALLKKARKALPNTPFLQ